MAKKAEPKRRKVPMRSFNNLADIIFKSSEERVFEAREIYGGDLSKVNQFRPPIEIVKIFKNRCLNEGIPLGPNSMHYIEDVLAPIEFTEIQLVRCKAYMEGALEECRRLGNKCKDPIIKKNYLSSVETYSLLGDHFHHRIAESHSKKPAS